MEEKPQPAKPVERLFPFVARARLLLVGRETLARSKRNLQCILLSGDISENSKQEILKEFSDYPVLQCFSSAQFEEFFGVRNAKVLGLKKSSLARSIYAELKQFRLNKPPPDPGAAKHRG